MNAPLYTTEILRLAASLPDPRQLAREDGRAELRSATCGSRVAVTVQLDESGHVAAISQQVHACAFGQASAALMERSATGRGAGDVREVVESLSSWLDGEDREPGWGLRALAPARSRKSRHNAILLPFRALQAAIEAAR